MVPFILVGALALGAPNDIDILSDENGHKLFIDGEPTMLFGMNWGYVPIGENYGYDLWSKSDAFIEQVLRREMPLLRDMGVNSIRQYAGIPEKWVTFIYDEYGITTMINPLVGRYGETIDGRFVADTNYADPRTREVLIEKTVAVIEQYKDTRGVVMFLLGNEANYGLSWSSFEIQALPREERETAKARALYSLYGEIIDRGHQLDANHPIAICNGDVQYIDLIAELAPNMDIFAANVYRGASSRDLFDVVEEKLGVPFVYSEFGADAFNARTGREDGLAQAEYLRSQWQEIYENAYGHGLAGNAIGGYVFQWTDGWWKYKQEENLDIHDTNASWPADAYPHDYVEGQNNMNEEWFGITSKLPPSPSGHFDVVPRSAYFLLRDAFQLDPYAQGTNRAVIAAHFAQLRPSAYDAEAAALTSRAQFKQMRVRLSELRTELYTFTSGGSERTGRGPANASFDHMESFYVGVEAKPNDQFRTSMTVNILGNSPDNRIDTIFYENRGDRNGEDEIDPAVLERVKIYGADFSWDNKAFTLEGYFRRGHTHWGYDGDFFGLYREAHYGAAIDIYNADVPLGMTFTGKGVLEGLSLAGGPQIFWGANPTVIGKYTRSTGPFTWTVMHQEDIAPAPSTQTSAAIAEQMLRRSTVHVQTAQGPFTLDVGGIWAGSNKIGQSYQRVVDADDGGPSYNGSGYHVLNGEVGIQDTFGGKAKLQVEGGPLRWYVQGAYKGLVADGGPDSTVTFTGWQLKESGRGNQVNALTGAVLTAGNLQIAPNLLFQKPLVGPNPVISDRYDPTSRWYFPKVSARNVIADPFAVLDNRETYGAELLLVYDPTPGSWFWMWNNDEREDANFAASLDFWYRHQPTVRDANFGFTEDGILFSFDGSPAAADEWQLSSRMVFNIGPTRIITTLYTGQQLSTGVDNRRIFRGGGNLRLWWRSVLLDGWVKVNDWGPYDYHRDFNLTFPLQVIGEASAGIGRPRLFVPNTRIGTQVKYRILDENSPDFSPVLPGQTGYEFEVGTYVKVAL